MKRPGILDSLFNKYADESFEVQTKIKTVFWVNVALSVVCTVFILLSNAGIRILDEHINTNVVWGLVAANIISIVLLYQKKYTISCLLTICGFQIGTITICILAVGTGSLADSFMFASLLQVLTLVLANIVTTGILTLSIVGFGPILYLGIFAGIVAGAKSVELSGGIQALATGFTALSVAVMTFLLAGMNNRNIINKIDKQNKDLQEILVKLKKAIIELVAISREMHASVEEQNSSATQQASGITEVSATLEELSITANQITENASDLVVASEETIQKLTDGQSELDSTVKRLDDVSRISRNNNNLIQQLGKRSKLINQMVEIIKDIANKTNMLSVNASIEASRAGESGKGFSVVASEIREMSKETIVTAKKVEETAFEIQTFINDIVIASVSETDKVQQSAEVSKNLFGTINQVVEMINKNYSFTQKIDVSITQQENGSRQAAETMRQLTEVANQAAMVAKQTAKAVQNIVDLSNDLESLVQKYND